MGGIMSITGEEGGAPTRVGASVGDVIAGIFTGYGIMLALYHRQLTGEGQLVDVAMLDCQIAILENAIARYATSGEVPAPLGNRHPSITPFAGFTAKDGSIIVGAGNDRLWVKLCNLIDRPDLIVDERFVDNGSRTVNVKELHAILNEVLSTKTIDEWLALLEEAGIPCAPINDVARIVKDPQIASRDMLVELTHTSAGPLKMAGVPVKRCATPGAA